MLFDNRQPPVVCSINIMLQVFIIRQWSKMNGKVFVYAVRSVTVSFSLHYHC